MQLLIEISLDELKFEYNFHLPNSRVDGKIGIVWQNDRNF